MVHFPMTIDSQMFTNVGNPAMVKGDCIALYRNYDRSSLVCGVLSESTGVLPIETIRSDNYTLCDVVWNVAVSVKKERTVSQVAPSPWG